VHEWSAANGLKLNLIKSQVIVISRCRVDIPLPTLLMGSDVIKVVLKVNNLVFVLNERLSATDYFKMVCQKIYWILHSLRPHLLCLTLDMAVLCMLVRMLHRNGGCIWLLEPVYGTFIL
jgi:hypothetical protein